MGSLKPATGLPNRLSYLIEGVEKLRDQRRPRAGFAEGVGETEMLEISDKAVGTRVREGKRVPPEIPLEGDDGEGPHTRPDHTQG